VIATRTSASTMAHTIAQVAEIVRDAFVYLSGYVSKTGCAICNGGTESLALRIAGMPVAQAAVGSA
jgi:hypothetical protein